MKLNFKFLAVLFLGIIVSSCSSDDDNNLSNGAPEISNFEYGMGGSDHGSDQYAYIGSDIHMEAEIYAEATVSSIAVSIHAHDLEVGEGEEEWDFEQTYTDEKYLVINPTFHEHIDIPTTAPAGEYHVVLTVTDQAGNSTEVEGHLDILDPITISDVSIDSSVARGSDLHAEFMINAVNGVHNILVDIHAHGLTLAEGEVEWDFEQTYEEGYHELTEVEFHEHIDVPATAPAGEYHMSITIEDENGNTTTFESHIDVTE
ncbi:DUF4625 domain-containing protein [Joostella sp. CR20]|uniref:DUF4625 domain-containing protein n=1 Tax=Joostella sp. CR20 TaxID=2804312 RepID=UPI00313E7CAF